jgi:hypothetical protein
MQQGATSIEIEVPDEIKAIIMTKRKEVLADP